MKLIVLAIVLIGALHLNAQNWSFLRHEVSFGIGATSFLGDLGGANNVGSHGIKGFVDYDLKMTRPVVQAGYRHYFSPNFAGKINLAYARLSGDDSQTKELFRQNRNLHFRSPLVELQAQVEYYPFGEYFGHLYRSNGVSGSRINKFSPYVFIGIGGAWFNPKAEYNGTWTALQPLKTEGVTYKKIAAIIPWGAGLKYALNRQWSIGFELTIRYSTSDYIDDVSSVYVDHSASDQQIQDLADPNIGIIPLWTDGAYVYDPTGPGQQRGESKYNDSYAFAIFSVNYKFLKYKRNLPKL